MDEERIDRLLDLAENAASEVTSVRNEENSRILAAVADDIEAAFEQCLGAGDAARALRFGAALRQHWQDTGRVAAGRRLTEAGLNLPDTPGTELGSARAAARMVAGELAFRQGDQERAGFHSRNAIAEAEALGLPVVAALGHLTLSRIALRHGDGAAIDREARVALELAGSNPLVRRGALHMLAWAALTQHGVASAIPLFEASLAYRRALGDRFSQAVELANLGDFAAQMGDDHQAVRYQRESLTLAWELRNHYLLSSLILSVAGLLGRRGDYMRASRLLAAGDAAYRASGLVPDPGPEADAAKARAQAETALPPATFAAAWRAGAELSLETAVEEANARLAEIGGFIIESVEDLPASTGT